MPDVRLIDANALMKRIEEAYCKDCNSHNGVMCRACEHMDDMDFIEDAPAVDAIPQEKWNELKETIIEMRDNGGTGTQEVVCKFLVNLMGIIERENGDEEDA